MENIQPGHSKVMSMSDEDKTHLLCTALLVLPEGHELRARIESIIGRDQNFSVNRVDASAMTQEQQSAWIAESEMLYVDLERAAIDAWRFVQ